MNSEVIKKIDSYPEEAKAKLLSIRKIILGVAQKEGLGEVMESLKWGEASYSVKSGSPIRIDWKQVQSSTVSIYFNCNTTLVDTFREIYGNVFTFSGNREIILPLPDELPVRELEHCVSIALRYHKVKHLPMLGA